MRVPRIQLSVRWIMIAVALVALNLTAALATWKHYPRKKLLPFGFGNGRGSTHFTSDGGILYARGNAEIGYRLEHVVRQLPPPTFLQIWSRVLAAAAVTALVLSLAPRPPAPRRRGSRARPPARWAVFATALFALNLAAAAYRPPWNHDYDPSWPSPFRKGEGTMVCNPDGSILAYPGPPGQIPPGSRPRVIRWPMRSRLEMWAPTLAAATITLVALLIARTRLIAQSPDEGPGRLPPCDGPG